MEGACTSKNEAATNAIIETLRTRGWCFGDLDQVKELIIKHWALSDGGGDNRALADSVESELLNSDLCSIGGKSLPDPNLIRRNSHLQGPKVLQIASVRDISVSSMKGFSDPKDHRRLLRLVLTDGHSEITAIEYSHLPSIPNDIVPGSKVRLENKAPVYSGIVCLNPSVITLLGGLVESLYEEWKINQKYSGFSRSSVRQSQEKDGGGPPPFVKLQVGAPPSRSSQQGIASGATESTSTSNATAAIKADGNTDGRLSQEQHNEVSRDGKAKMASQSRASNSVTRMKEVAESAPVQNQAAAQKLLQKMSQSNHADRQLRGHRQRGKYKQEEKQVFTLDEWEKRKPVGKPPTKNDFPDTSRDEELAWQLQNELDIKDSHGSHVPQNSAADDIRMSMFKFGGDADGIRRVEHGGRGRGRGSGRGKVMGRGRGR